VIAVTPAWAQTTAVGAGFTLGTEAPEATRRLAKLCDHLPLALQIVAALLADEPDRPIVELVEELASEEDRLNSLEYDTDLSVRAAFALSYKRLPDALQRLFRLLSVVPGGDVGLETAGWLISVSHTAVRPQLMALVRSHLIQQHVRNRWSMHDLIRLYSAELSALEPEDSERALKSIVQRYIVGVAGAAEWLTAVVSENARKLFSSPQHAAGWFEAERTTAIAIVITLAKRPTTASGFSPLPSRLARCWAHNGTGSKSFTMSRLWVPPLSPMRRTDTTQRAW
jgi:hypothetical protein